MSLQDVTAAELTVKIDDERTTAAAKLGEAQTLAREVSYPPLLA